MLDQNGAAPESRPSGSQLITSLELPMGLRFGFVDPAKATPEVCELLSQGVSDAVLTPQELAAAYRRISKRSLKLLSAMRGVATCETDALQFVAFEDSALPAKNLFAVLSTQRGQAFVKIAGTERSRQALMRESLGLNLGRAAGLQVPETLCEYQVDEGGLAVLATSFISPRDAIGFPNSVKSRDLVTPEMGRALAAELLALFKMDSAALPSGTTLPWVEKHMESISIFREEFERRALVLRRSECAQIADSCVRDVRYPETPGSQVLLSWLEESNSFLTYLDRPSPSSSYFCLGDVGPQNIFFAKRYGTGEAFSRPVVFYDLEVIGKAPHWGLQALVDWGRFFHRTSPNVEAQSAFLLALVEGAPLGSPSETATFLSALILARVVMTAHIVEGPQFNPEYPRLDRLAALLESVGPALAQLQRLA